LKSIKEKGREGILLNILDPNRNVNPQYANYTVITDDGLSISGMIAAETANSITLRRAEGESDTVLRAKIDELVDTGISIMPEGLEKQISKQDMAHLLQSCCST
jgi:putative heme-binding domain-containing protein